MKPIICIDAGHGGKDPGALGPDGLQEKDVALSVAMLLGAMLAPHFTVVYTRRDDRFIELGNRAMIANDAGADAIISIHCNSGDPGKGDGFEVFTTPGLTASDKLATDLFTAYAKEFPEKRKRMDLGDGDPDKEANFTVIRRANMRAVLFELEFIHTPAGESWLRDVRNRSRCAGALAGGILHHFGLMEGAPVVEPVPVAPAPATQPTLKDQILGKLAELQTLVESL